ncbi:MAG: hypothetical protein M5T61_10845 [Acidimicrobiia bacterium]|nr:hypothetical protein [Acidimicrobiia bacterium]
MVLAGDDGSSDGAAATSVPPTVAGATTSTSATTTTEPGRSLPPDSFDVYSTRNPFEPAFQETPVTTAYTTSTTGYFGTTSTSGYAGTTTTVFGATTTTGVGGTTTTTQPSYNPPQGTTVALLDVFFDGPTAIARVQVGSTVYTVAAGDVFGPGNSYRVVSLDEPCGQFLYGDSPFELCEGQQVIK